MTGFEIASIVLGALGTLSSVVAVQFKKQIPFLILLIFSNLFVASSFVFLGVSKMSGGLICFIATIHTVINFLYMRKGKEPHLAVFILFGALYIGATVLTAVIAGAFSFPYDTLPTVCAFLFMFAISTKNVFLSRTYTLVNSVTWVLYDLLGAKIAYMNLATHIFLVVSTVIGIVRYVAARKKDQGEHV